MEVYAGMKRGPPSTVIVLSNKRVAAENGSRLSDEEKRFIVKHTLLNMAHFAKRVRYEDVVALMTDDGAPPLLQQRYVGTVTEMIRRLRTADDKYRAQLENTGWVDMETKNHLNHIRIVINMISGTVPTTNTPAIHRNALSVVTAVSLGGLAEPFALCPLSFKTVEMIQCLLRACGFTKEQTIIMVVADAYGLTTIRVPSRFMYELSHDVGRDWMADWKPRSPDEADTAKIDITMTTIRLVRCLLHAAGFPQEAIEWAVISTKSGQVTLNVLAHFARKCCCGGLM